MLDKFVANLLTSYLGKYIANLDKQHVKVSLWHGHVVLKDLQLKPNALRYLDLPVSVKEGRIGELIVTIPWTKLQSESIKVEIHNVVVIVHPKKAAVFDPEQEEKDAWERKEEALQVFEALRNGGGSKSKSTDDPNLSSVDSADLDAATDNTFAARLKATMLNNLLVSVHNVLVQYEDTVTNPMHPIALTARVSAFHAMSCDADYAPSFASPKAPLFFKLVRLEGFALYVESLSTTAAAAPPHTSSDLSSSPPPPSSAGRYCHELVGRYDSSSTTSNSLSSSSQLSTVLRPLTFVVKLQHQPIPFQPETPRWLGVVEVDATTIHVNRAQWDAVWRSVKYVQRFDQFAAFLQYRPAVPVMDDPRAWWRFAGLSVKLVLSSKKKRTRFDWAGYVKAKSMEREYMELHKRRQPAAPWLVALTKAELKRCDELEHAMSVESIKLARSLAYARLALEAEQHTAREQYLAAKKSNASTSAAAASSSQSSAAASAKKKGGGGWWAWWSGTSASTEPVAETEEDQKEIEKLWGLIDADRWSEQQRRVIAKELGINEAEMAGLYESTSTATAGGEDKRSSPERLRQTLVGGGGGGRAVQCFARLSSVYIALLDYDDHVFASFSLEELGAAFRTDGGGVGGAYSLRAHIGDFSLNDEQHEASPIRTGTRKAEQQHRVAIVRTAKERTSAAAVRLWLRKERQQRVCDGTHSTTSAVLPDEDDVRWIPSKYRTMELAAIRFAYDRCPTTQHCIAAGSAASIAGGATSAPPSSPLVGASPSPPPEFVTTVQLLPMDVRMSVPWLQRVVRFWGVDMKLVDDAAAGDNATTADSGSGSQRRRVVSLLRGVRDQLTSLIALVERTPLSFTRIAAKDLCVVIPEEAVEQELRVHCEEFTVANDWLKASMRKKRLLLDSASQIQGTTCKEYDDDEVEDASGDDHMYSSSPLQGAESQRITAHEEDWTDNWKIELVRLSLYTAWRGGYAAPLLKAVSGSITLRKLLIVQRLETPRLAVDVLFPHDVCLEGPLEGYEVLFSSITALTDFLNNASGRGVVDASSKTSAGSSVREEFICLVQGPQMSFAVADESLLTPLQQHAAPPVPCQRRLVEVARGCVTLYHSARPSMAYAKLELKPNQFHIVRDGATLTLFIERGGKHHISRQHLVDAREMMASALGMTVSDIVAAPLPQLWFLLGERFQRPPSSAFPQLTSDDKEELLGCYGVMEDSSNTVPCHAAQFTLDSEKEAERMERIISRSTALEGLKPPKIPSVAEARNDAIILDVNGNEVAPQLLVDVVLAVCGEFALKVRPCAAHTDCVYGRGGAPPAGEDDDEASSGPSTTNGTTSCVMPNFAMNFSLTKYTRTIEVSATSLALWASDEIRVAPSNDRSSSDDPQGGWADPTLDDNLGRSIEEQMAVRRVAYMFPKHIHADSSDAGSKRGSSDLPSSPSPRTPSSPKTTKQRDASMPKDDDMVPKIGPDDAFLLSFESSWLPGTTGLVDIHCLGNLQLLLNDDFAAAGEILWDLLGVMMMKQYSTTLCCALPWETQAECISNPLDKIERMVIDFACHGEVEVLLEYEAGGPYRNLPKMPKGTQARLTGQNLTLRWRVNELMNETSMGLDEPKLETFFHRYTALASGGSPYSVFVTPRRPQETDGGSPPSPASPESTRRQSASCNVGNMTRLIPASSTAISHMKFSYQVLYQPAGISESAWRSSVGSTTGYMFTHYLTVALQNSLLRYWQQDLWHLIEYFTNGLMHRVGMISWRRPFAIQRPQYGWPLPRDAPGPSFSTALLHKHIELSDCELCLPHDAMAAPQLWGFVERMTMWDEVVAEHETDCFAQQKGGTPAAGEDGRPTTTTTATTRDDYFSTGSGLDRIGFETCEARTGFKIDFSGLSIWAARPLPGTHKVVTSAHFSEDDVLYRNPDFTDLIVNNLSLRYWMLFDASCMLKQESQKTLGMKFGELHFHGSSEQLGLLFDWISGVFVKNPWVGKYAPKVFARSPFPNLAERDGKAWITYDYHIEVDRFMLHLRDPVITYAATPNPDGPCIDRQPINIVLDLKRAKILLRWLSDQSFFSQYAIEAIDGWDFMRTSWKTASSPSNRSSYQLRASPQEYQRDIFVKTPREIVSTQQHFLKIVPADAAGAASLLVKHGRGGTGVGGALIAQGAEERFGLDIVYGWKNAIFYDGAATDEGDMDATATLHHQPSSGGKEEKIVYSQTDIGCIEIDVVPRFLYDVKDSLASLRVRNAIAPLFRWPAIAAFEEPGAPWDPMTQEWRTRHSAQVQVVTVVFFDLTRKTPSPSFFVSMEDISVTAESTMYRASSKMYAQMTKVSQNGICDDALQGRPLLVPQSTTVNAEKFHQYASRRRDPQEKAPHQREELLGIRRASSSTTARPTNLSEEEQAAGPNRDSERQQPPPLLWIDQSSERGLVGEFGCVWVFVPLKEQLQRLKGSLMDEGLRDLAWISVYAEERYARREGLFPVLPPPATPTSGGPSTVSAAAVDSTASDIHFTIYHPCLVVSEHESMLSQATPAQQRGVVINLGLMVLGSTFVPLDTPTTSTLLVHESWAASVASPPSSAVSSATRMYTFRLDGGHMRSLHRDTHQLIKPMNIRVDGARKEDGCIDIAVRLDGLHIDVALEYYESILRSVVRHLLVDEEEMVEQKLHQRASLTGGGSDALSMGGRSSATGFSTAKSAKLRKASVAATSAVYDPRRTQDEGDNDVEGDQGDSLGGGGGSSKGRSGARRATAPTPAALALSKMTVHLQWDFVRIRVFSETMAVTFAVGRVVVEYSNRSGPRSRLLKQPSSRRGVKGEDAGQDARGSKGGGRGGKDDHDAAATAGSSGNFSGVRLETSVYMKGGADDDGTSSEDGGEVFAYDEGSEVLLQPSSSSAAGTPRPDITAAGGPQRYVKPSLLDSDVALGSDARPSRRQLSSSHGGGIESERARDDANDSPTPSTPKKKSARRKRSATTAASTAVVYRKRPAPQLVSITSISASLEFLRLGVDGRQPLVAMESKDAAPDKAEGHPAAVGGGESRPVDDPPIQFSMTSMDQDWKINGDLGITRIVLEHNSLVNAISFLYEPYRRIVLPKYTAFEVKDVSDDITLSQRMLLSTRTVLRVSSKEKNHITINANGHPIHFLDSGGRSLIILESGMTLRIINATVYLYGRSLDHYVTAGNGSYVVLDPLLCNVVAGSSGAAVEEEKTAQQGEEGGEDVDKVGDGPDDDEDDEDDDDDDVYAQPSLSSVKSFAPGADLRHVVSNRVLWVPRNVSQQMAVRAAFFLLVPEHQGHFNDESTNLPSSIGQPHRSATSSLLSSSSRLQQQQQQKEQQQQRALMLAANISCAWSLQLFSGELAEQGLFEITDLEAECQYLRGAQKTDYSSLISPWEVKVDVVGQRRFMRDEHMRSITIASPVGVDFRFRYGDIQLSLAAVSHAKAALGHIESNVIVAAATAVEPQNEFAALEMEQDDEANRRLQENGLGTGEGAQQSLNSKSKSRRKEHNPLVQPGKLEMTVSTRIPRVGVYLVDDSSSMDFPLFFVSVTNISTPVCHTAAFLTKLHLSFGFQVEYYNFHASAWDRLVEPVTLDIVIRELQNRSLQDVQARRGLRKAGVHIKSLRVRFTPMAAEAVSRTLRLLNRLSDQQTSNPAAEASDSTSGSAGSVVSSQEFFAYEVTQQLGPEIKIGFADDDKGRFPKPRALRMMETYSFNFPRIEGRELPASQHYIVITTETSEQLLRISRVGLQIISLQFGGIRQDVVVDIQVREGKKRVTLRSNISFENKLPFPIVLGGIGSVFVGGSQTASTDAMRRRCVMVPQLPFRCHEVSMGVTYDALPNHYNQTFLCTAEIDDPEVQKQHQREAERAYKNSGGNLNDVVPGMASMQRAVYFLLRFAPKLKISEHSNLYDCKAVFEAPFSIVNNTGLPITITLLCKQPHTRAKQGMFDFSEKFSFMPIDAVFIPAQSRSAITQVDPLRDVFLDVTFQQNNGASIARMGAKRQSAPALIRSDKKATRDTSLILHDPKGESIMLRIDYADREVILYCAFWLVNQTTHVLQVTDTNPKRRGYMLAGMAPEGLPPSGTPFAFGSEKMDRLKDKAHIYIRVGRNPQCGSSSPTSAHATSAVVTAETAHKSSSGDNAGQLMWSQWSDAILITPVGEWSVFQCGDTEPVTLSYSIQFVGGALKDTRVVCITPRWIVVNRTPFSVGMRQENVRFADETENGPLPSMESRVMDFAAVKGANLMQVKLAQVTGEIDRGVWTQAFPMDVFGDQYVNIRYEQVVHAPDNPAVVIAVRKESIVACVSVYRRGSTLYIVLEKASIPPYTIENRSQYPVFVVQSGLTSSKLTVYPHVTKGFVWDDPSAHPLVMVLSAATSISGRGSSRPIEINLEASLLVKRTKFQLQQELLLPGGVTLFVRVRAMAGSFAISICEDSLIDRMRSLPFLQCSYQLQLDSFYVLVSSAQEDLMLLTVKPIRASMTQQCPADGDEDEQHIEVSMSVVQLDDERASAQERVVLQLIDGRSTHLKLQRKMQRLTPIIHVTKLEYVMQPVEIHMEDSFLFAVLKLVETLQETFASSPAASTAAAATANMTTSSTVGRGEQQQGVSAVTSGRNATMSHKTLSEKKQKEPTPTSQQLHNEPLYPAAPWAQEIEAAKSAVASEESLQNKVAFIERLLIEQIVVSLSLYRAHDVNNDPIRDKLGFLSVLIRSVQDARVDWRRVEQSNIYDRIWLLATLYSNFYAHTLQAQMLNVLHVAGLDVMRGFVTDLLQSYFSSTATTHIDRSRPRIPRRREARLLVDVERESQGGVATGEADAMIVSQEGSGAWDKMDDAAQVTASSRWIKFGSGSSKGSLTIEGLAYQQPWNSFVEQITNQELRKHGHHALCHAVRTRNFFSPPTTQSRCTRCIVIDQMREDRVESGSMSVLPHPDSKLLDWDEFAHHVSWEEFVAICAPDEVRRYASIVRDSILGTPRNVVRIDGGLMWCLKE